nr:hypothetical protein [Tanacetum cinerariifolium]
MLRPCLLLYKRDLVALEDCKSAGYLRNKPDLDTMSFDDLYNNFKIVKQEVKETTSSSSSSQNMTFVSSPSSTNEVNIAYGVSNANTQVSPASTQVSTVNTQDITSNLNNEVPTNMALMDFLDSERSSNSLSLKAMKLRLVTVLVKIFLMVKKSPNSPLVKELVSDDKGNPQLELQKKGVINRGCSRHMTGNMSYLSEYEEINGGYVAFGGDPKRGKITDTECVILSPDFKLLDESQVLLRVPKKKNIYNVDLKNVAPSGDHLGKFDGKADDGFFVGYSVNNMAFRVFNNRTSSKDSLGDGSNHQGEEKKDAKDPENEDYEDNDVDKDIVYGCADDPNMPNLEEINYSDDNEDVGAEADMTNLDSNIPVSPILTTRIHKDHPVEQIVRDIHSAPQTRRMTKNVTNYGMFSSVQQMINHKDFQNCLFACFLSQVEAKKVIQALTDPSWIEAMQDELLQFKLQQVWTLVNLPYGKRAIGTKWIYKNKKDKRGIMVRNKARLVAQDYTQEDGTDYDEIFVLVTRIEAIRLFLAYALFKDFVVYQIDVKSAFLYGKIEEEVYVCQPSGFEDLEFSDRVYKVEKALYGLHQALRAWYETLSTYLLDNGFHRGQIDKTLFIKRFKEFEKMMHKKFQISSIGELTFFLGLQVTQKDDGIFINQDKYVDEILKKFGFLTVKTASTPMETSKPLLKDENAEDVDVHIYRSMISSLMYLTSLRPDIMFVDSPFNLEAYTDSDYAGASLDRKFTTGGCQFLGSRLISWQCKKQIVVANSITEADKLYTNDEWNEVRQLVRREFRLTLATAKVKHVNKVAQIHAKVDGKRVVISKASIRSDLRFRDEGDEAVYEEIYDSVERVATTIIGLDAEQDRGIISKTQFTVTLNEPSFIMTSSCSGPRRQETMGMLLLRLGLREYLNFLMTHLSQELTHLETNQALEIKSLKRRVKKLEKKANKRTHKLNILNKIGFLRRTESLYKASLGDRGDASKQGRIINNLDVNEGVTLVDETQGRNDQDMFDTGVAEKEVSTADPVTTGGEIVTTAGVEVSATATTPIISMDDIALGKALADLKSAKPMVKELSIHKATGIVMQEPEEITIRTTTTVPSQSSKDKGKAKIIEPEKPLMKKDQIMIDEEVARNLKAQLQAELEEEERLARQKEEEANIALIDE